MKEKATAALRAGHLLRISGYLDTAILSMWLRTPRASVMIGMSQASVRGAGPGGGEEELLEKLRALLDEAVEYYADDDFPAAMARMRVAHDMVGLRIVQIAGS